MLSGGIDEAGSKPKKGTGTFYYFSQQFQSQKQNLNTNKGACLFYFPVSSASVLELAGTVTLILYLLQIRHQLLGFCLELHMHRLNFHRHPHTWGLVRQL
jgi:hypothetical protein